MHGGGQGWGRGGDDGGGEGTRLEATQNREGVKEKQSQILIKVVKTDSNQQYTTGISTRV